MGEPLLVNYLQIGIAETSVTIMSVGWALAHAEAYGGASDAIW